MKSMAFFRNSGTAGMALPKSASTEPEKDSTLKRSSGVSASMPARSARWAWSMEAPAMEPEVSITKVISRRGLARQGPSGWGGVKISSAWWRPPQLSWKSDAWGWRPGSARQRRTKSRSASTSFSPSASSTLKPPAWGSVLIRW